MRHRERLPGIALLGLITAAALPASAKETRAGFADVTYQLLESDSFALRWQPEQVAVQDDQARAVLAVLEDAYARFHGGLDHGLPYGCDLYRMNVYISGAAGTPGIDTYGGYLSFDDDYYPYIVLGHEMIAVQDPGLPLVLVHEYYHAVQCGTEAYWSLPVPSDPVGWYYEATANWSVTAVYPDDDVVFGDLAGYLGATEQPLFLSVFDQASPLLGHEYGAFLFPLFLDLFHGGPQLIRDSWEQAGPDDDPLEVLDALTPGASIGELFAEFAARNAVWDYPPAVREGIEGWLPLLGVPTPALQVGPAGTEGMVAVDPARALHAFGYHLIEIALSPDSALWLELEVDAQGSRGTSSALLATLVVREGDEVRYTPLAIEQGQAAMALPSGQASDLVYLAVACAADTRDSGETFSYRLRVGAVADDAVDDGMDDAASDDAEAAGCGCAARGAGPRGPALLLMLLIPLGLRRGRRGRGAPGRRHHHALAPASKR